MRAKAKKGSGAAEKESAGVTAEETVEQPGRGKKKANGEKREADPASTPDACPPAVDETEALNGRLLRLQADFENFRKRTLREKGELYRRANEEIMLELLPVLDHLDLALDAAADHGADEALIQGFRLVSDQMLSVLRKFGLEPIDADSLRCLFKPLRMIVSRPVSTLTLRSL